MSSSKYVYPKTKREVVVDTYNFRDYGKVSVEDPHRWLEDADSEDTKAWVEEQIATFDKYKESEMKDVRSKIRKRFDSVYNYPKYSTPFKRGDLYFFFKNDGLQDQSVLYSQESLEAEPKVFIDPNTLSKDGTTAMGITAFSDSGKYFAYGLSNAGSDWQTINIKTTVEKGATEFKEKLDWIKFSSVSWTHDDKGFFYARYPEQVDTADKDDKGTGVKQLKNHALYYHVLGTEQDKDVLVYEDKDNDEWMVGSEVSDCGNYVILSIFKDCDPINKIYYAPLAEKGFSKDSLKFVKLVDDWKGEYGYITNTDGLFYFKTNVNAPKYKLISVDLSKPDSWKDVIPESDTVLSYVQCVNQNVLVASFMKDVVDVVELYDMEGKSCGKIPLGLGTVASLSGRKKDSTMFIKFTSFLTPGTIYRYDFSKPDAERLTVFRESEIEGFDASMFQTEQVFYPSKDGTKIPMFIIRRKDLKLDGSNPTILYGYGGFNIPIQPSFSALRLVWMQNLCGVYAIANIRGGGEYGEEWHKAGTKGDKQNVFDDFAWASKYLVANKYTSHEKIGIYGGSNGGLLVGACVNQFPDLFGAGVAAVGVLDMLRFHKFTIGYAWCSDYGNADEGSDFEFLIKYSPIHNVRKGKPYPSVLLTTADHDDRVSPLHSYKFIATLQHELGQEEYQKNPLMIRIQKKGGHGGFTPTSITLDEYADVYGFMAARLQASWTE